MREIPTEIEIAAFLTQVWDKLMDFEKWQDWNPTANKAGGLASLGSKLDITMSEPEGKDDQKYTATITTFEAPRLFRWRTVMLAGFLMTNERSFELEPVGGRTLC
ncbi:MAG: SRPBCC domain-containing protein, partial [Candidatus Marinimicrobia bacterium]|nr:SRPBCC domain-containing protein [Candidatus Neomarinimicrobiota bacterium]